MRPVSFLLVCGCIAALGGCMKPEMPPAEKFIRSTLSADFRNLSYNGDGTVICGEAGSNASGKFKRFFSHWQQRRIASEGSDDYSFRKYVLACGMTMSEQELAAEEARQADEAKSEQRRAQYEASREARERWLEQNGEAIKSLHDAAEVLQRR